MTPRACLFVCLLLLIPSTAVAKECPPGFEFKPNSGVGCVQMDCFNQGGHWSSTQQCICAEGKKPCRCSVDYSGFDDEKCFPDCPFTKLVSCIDVQAECPPCAGESNVPPEQESVGAASSTDGPPALTLESLTVAGDGITVAKPGGSWENYRDGQNLQSGDRVRVPSQGRTRIELPAEEGSPWGRREVYVSGPAEFVLPAAGSRRPSFAPRQTLLEMIAGGFLLRIKRLFGIASQEELGLSSSQTQVGIRGTEFVFNVDPDRAVDHVMLHEGEAVVEGKVRGSAVLRAGQQVWVREGVVGEVQPLSEQEWSATAARFTLEEQSTVTTASGCQGILGLWRWFNGAMVECSEDGRCTANNGFSGPWKCIDPAGQFEIRWAQAGQQVAYVDTLSLAPGGGGLQGTNQSGQGVGGRRPEFSGGDPQSGCEALIGKWRIGKWRWHGGAGVECLPEGTCTSDRDVSGPWRCLAESGRFEIRWGREGRPDLFIDTVQTSPLGSYLTGTNQYGVATGATRE
jgi:hypothetical protein